MKVVAQRCLLSLIWLIAGAQLTSAQAYGPMRTTSPPERGLPVALREVGIEQRLDQPLPLDAVFTDEERRQVTLGQYFGGRPVVLAFVYYDCPMMCTQVLNGLAGALKALSFDAGREFEVVTISFDPRERANPGLAAEKKQVLLQRYQRATAPAGLHLLTGDDANIRRVTEAAGFKYQWDKETKQYAHAAGIMIATPEGRLARYLYGIEYAPRDLRLGLVEAAAGKIGSPVDALLLYCYHYDPATGRYSATVLNLMRAAGVLFLIVAAGVYFWLWRRRAPAGVAGRAMS